MGPQRRRATARVEPVAGLPRQPGRAGAGGAAGRRLSGLFGRQPVGGAAHAGLCAAGRAGPVRGRPAQAGVGRVGDPWRGGQRAGIGRWRRPGRIGLAPAGWRPGRRLLWRRCTGAGLGALDAGRLRRARHPRRCGWRLVAGAGGATVVAGPGTQRHGRRRRRQVSSAVAAVGADAGGRRAGTPAADPGPAAGGLCRRGTAAGRRCGGSAGSGGAVAGQCRYADDRAAAAGAAPRPLCPPQRQRDGRRGGGQPGLVGGADGDGGEFSRRRQRLAGRGVAGRAVRPGCGW